MKIIFATNNQHKVEEARIAIGEEIEIISLREAGIDIDIPEPHATLEENASEKSRAIYKLTGANCFSEDTGLEVESLNGEPGVRSARYAGEEKSFADNIEKLLKNLHGKTNRKARFRAVISLIINGKENIFEGIVYGSIIEHPRGEKGFGYDPIFVPEGAIHTFAEMGAVEKNQYSHRKRAIDELIDYLKKLDLN
jgi:XTP/dITP diphosphohydrolase